VELMGILYCGRIYRGLWCDGGDGGDGGEVWSGVIGGVIGGG
jgi:hypothetical protein